MLLGNNAVSCRLEHALSAFEVGVETCVVSPRKDSKVSQPSRSYLAALCIQGLDRITIDGENFVSANSSSAGRSTSISTCLKIDDLMRLESSLSTADG